MYALIDCNSFFVSCEKVFRPDLENRPVIVLSCNDGCVISRSREAKAIGIKMGEPVFKCRHLIKKYNVVEFSVNFSLYGDFSDRVMQTLNNFSPQVEIYSIDEAFIKIPEIFKYPFESPSGELKQCSSYTDYGKLIKETVYKWTSIPVSIGIAPTKTLAKAASYFCKNVDISSGVLELTTEKAIDEVLAATPVGEIWGVGSKLRRNLKFQGINTALDLKLSNERLIKAMFGITMLRTINELRGLDCSEPIKDLADIDDATLQSDRKSIICSRSFGTKSYQYQDLMESVATHISRGAEKLRRESLKTASLSVFIRADRFKENPYHGGKSVRIDPPTCDTRVLIKHAEAVLDEIFIPGLRYEKSGIVFTDLDSYDNVQLRFRDLLADSAAASKSHARQPVQHDLMDKKDESLLHTLDKLNHKYGKRSLGFASCGVREVKSNRNFLSTEGSPAFSAKQHWLPNSNLKSPEYTTRLQDIPVIKI